jgi:hypothetical protein
MRHGGRVVILGLAIVLACGTSSNPDGPPPPGAATLALSVKGPGSVGVTVGGGTPSQTGCHGDAQCSISGEPGATVTATAGPDGGARFDGWGGVCGNDADRMQASCTFRLADGAALSATFDLGPPPPPQPPPSQPPPPQPPPSQPPPPQPPPPQPPMRITIDPAAADLPTGGSARFTASVSGTDDGRVAWSVREGAAGGTVDESGIYTAPAAAGTFHVVATSVPFPAVSTDATVTVHRLQTTVAIHPATIGVLPGDIVSFFADVDGATNNAAVTWSVAEGAAGGTVDDRGVYVAPLTPGAYHVVATSRAAPDASAVATVTVPLPNDLYDRGGRIIPDAHVYAVWWGDRAGFGDAIGAVDTLFTSLSGTNWLATLDQYLRGANARVTFVGNLYEASTPPTAGPVDPGVIACNAIDASGLNPDPSAIYFVYAVVPSTGAFFASGWHGNAACHGVSIVTATVLADGNGWFACPDGLSHVGSWFVGVSTHELAEAMTDPGPSWSWSDGQGKEVADKCTYVCATFGGRTAGTTALWSNAAGQCVPP